jgi:hypothetical protein
MDLQMLPLTVMRFVSFVFTNPLVTASNGGRSPWSWLPNCPHDSAAAILPHNYLSLKKTNLRLNLSPHSKSYLFTTELLSQSQSYITTDGQSSSLSWYQVPIWDPRPVFILLSLIIFRQSRICWCGTLSLTRNRVCSFQLLLDIACAAFLRSESHGTNEHILLPRFFLDSPNLEGRRSNVEATLRLTVSQSVCLGNEHSCGTCDQILLPVGMLLSEICGLVSVGCPLWGEDGSAVCSVITQWSKSPRTRNHTLLSYLRLPQPWGPGSGIYIPQEQGEYNFHL